MPIPIAAPLPAAAHARSRPVRWLALLPVIGLVAIGCTGGDDAAPEDARTVEVQMADIAFDPASITVAEGETVRLRFTNDGELPHDAFIGDAAAQAAHEEEMRAAEGQEGHDGHGADDAALTVEPGEVGELVHTFTGEEDVLIGCHQPGHYDAGMMVQVELT